MFDVCLLESLKYMIVVGLVFDSDRRPTFQGVTVLSARSVILSKEVNCFS